MKNEIEFLIQSAITSLVNAGTLPDEVAAEVTLSRPREAKHGDYATSIALQLAKPARRKPRELAEAIVAVIGEDARIERIEIAGPGFINIHLSPAARQAVIGEILTAGENYGRSRLGAGRKIQVEFVSANPTGPLHVGHGRGAAYGAALAELLAAAGFSVHREYYVNDAGRQMDILAASVWMRYLQRCGIDVPFPANAYKGDYVREYAEQLYAQEGDGWAVSRQQLLDNLPPDAPEGGDKETYIDALITRVRELLGDNRYRFVFELGLNLTLDDIRDDLAAFGVEYDEWFSERSLTERGRVNKVIEQLRDANLLYEKDGALWFRSSEFGDEKDRVVQRDNGQTTYFASDIAYHLDKFERGFERVIDIWGADHHGYIPRVKAALTALGIEAERLDVLLVQFAILYRGGERVQMSTRSGSFVTLRELREEVGKDAARFFYVMRAPSQHLDFDLDLAKSQSADNPVYYIQYAHARVASVMRQLAERGLAHDRARGLAHLHRLTSTHEQALINLLGRYPELIESAALAAEPHQIAQYLRELAQGFHTWYNAEQFIVEDAELRDARLNLCLAVQQVIRNGLHLLGVSAPEIM